MLERKRLQSASEGGNVEIRILQVVAERVPNCQTSHSIGLMAVRIQPKLWHSEYHKISTVSHTRV